MAATKAIRGIAVVRSASFAQAVQALEADGISGIQATVDVFIKALRAGADTFGGRQLADGERVHRADNPSRNADGRGQFCIQYRRETSATGGNVRFTLIDMWQRSGGELADPE